MRAWWRSCSRSGHAVGAAPGLAPAWSSNASADVWLRTRRCARAVWLLAGSVCSSGARARARCPSLAAGVAARSWRRRGGGALGNDGRQIRRAAALDAHQARLAIEGTKASVVLGFGLRGARAAEQRRENPDERHD